MIPLQPPKSHPVLRDPTVPYRANKQSKKFHSVSIRPSKIHVNQEQRSVGSGTNNKGSRSCIVGSKNRYDKKGRQRMIKFSKTMLHATNEDDYVLEEKQLSVSMPAEEEKEEKEEEDAVSEAENEEDDLTGVDVYHSRSVSPEANLNQEDEADKAEEDIPPSTPIPIAKVTGKSIVTAPTKQYEAYEDATFVTGLRSLPNWVRTERKNALQRVLQERFGKRYAISRWNRKKKLPEYDAFQYADLF